MVRWAGKGLNWKWIERAGHPVTEWINQTCTASANWWLAKCDHPIRLPNWLKCCPRNIDYSPSLSQEGMERLRRRQRILPPPPLPPISLSSLRMGTVRSKNGMARQRKMTQFRCNNQQWLRLYAIIKSFLSRSGKWRALPTRQRRVAVLCFRDCGMSSGVSWGCC